MEAISPAEARSLGLKALYLYSNPQELITTQWGDIQVKDWLQKEAERINADPARTARVVQWVNSQTLYVNVIGGKWYR